MIKHSILVFTLIILMVSCVTGPIIVPEDLTPMELIQLAQEASDRNRFSQAIQYYEAVLERFPHNIDHVCAAEYEIAFIHYKQRRYTMAREGFNNLLERYDVPDAALLPQQYRVLANIVLARIDEIEEARNR